MVSDVLPGGAPRRAAAPRRRPVLGRVAATAASCLVLAITSSVAPAPALATPTPFRPVLSVVAGSGTAGSPGASSNTGPALAATLNTPHATAVDPRGDLLVADYHDSRLAKVDLTAGTVSTLAGNGTTGAVQPGPATSSPLRDITSVVTRGTDVYFSDLGNAMILKVDAAGQLSTVAGNGTVAAAGALATTTGQALRGPRSLAFDSAGNLIFTEEGNHRIGRIDLSSGSITTLAGDGTAGPLVPGPASSSRLDQPWGLATDGSGQLFFSEWGSDRVGKIDLATGTLSIVAGNGSYGPAVAGPALSSPLNNPSGLAVDAAGNLYIADNGNSAIQQVDSSGRLATLVGSTSGASGAPTPGPAASSLLNFPTGVTWAGPGVLYVSDSMNHRVEKVVLPTGTLPTITSAAPTTAVAGTTVATTLTASGSPSTWSVSSGSLPGWLSLSAQGVLSGTAPGQPVVLPTFTVRATNGAGYDEQTISLTVVPGGSDGLLPQPLTTDAPRTLPLTSRTAALNAVAVGALSYLAVTPSVCSVSPAGVVTALRVGTCTVAVAAAATSVYRAATASVDIAVTASGEPALPRGPQRFGGPDRFTTCAAVAEHVFPTPAAGAPVDVVLVGTDYRSGARPDAAVGARLAGQVGGPLLLTGGRELSSSTAAEVQRLAGAGGTVYLVGGEAALSRQVQEAVTVLAGGARVVRTAGPDRFATAVAVAEATVRRSGDVGPIYLVTGLDPVDGAAVDAYAQTTGGVVLLTDGGQLPAATAAYLAAHDPRGERTVPVGGAARSAAGRAGLAGAVQRAVVGSDRYETAADLALSMATASRAAGRHLTSTGLAGGTSWPDAFCGAAGMAALGGPLLLTPAGSDAVPRVTAAALQQQEADRLVVFGDDRVVTSPAVRGLGDLLRR